VRSWRSPVPTAPKVDVDQDPVGRRRPRRRHDPHRRCAGALASPREAHELGIRTVHQELSLVPQLNATRTSCSAGCRTLGSQSTGRRRTPARKALLDRAGFHRSTHAQSSAGAGRPPPDDRDRQGASSTPRVLILDEPSAVPPATTSPFVRPDRSLRTRAYSCCTCRTGWRRSCRSPTDDGDQGRPRRRRAANRADQPGGDRTADGRPPARSALPARRPPPVASCSHRPADPHRRFRGHSR